MSRAKGGLGTPALPQVNLLPPEVRSARSLGVVKRWLAVTVLLAVVVAGLGFGFATMQVGDAEGELEAQNAHTATLLDEQRQYSEVPVVLSRIDAIKAARQLGMSTEVLWQDYVDALVAVAPEDMTIESLTVSTASPMVAPALPANALAGSSVGQITFSGRVDVVPDTAAWIDALNSVPGLQDAWVSAVQISADGETPYYQVTSSVQVGADAYAERFIPAPETATATEESEG